MADVRINIYENFSQFHSGAIASTIGNGSILMQGVYIPGSISFNKIAMMKTSDASNNTTNSLYFGLYSLNASTLSLANTGSLSYVAETNIRWITLGTSATQDITPGNWYLAFLAFGAGSTGPVLSTVGGGNLLNGGNGDYGGPFVIGVYSTSTGALPATIATSNMVKLGTSTSRQDVFPYILISA